MFENLGMYRVVESKFHLSVGRCEMRRVESDKLAYASKKVRMAEQMQLKDVKIVINVRDK